MEAFQRGVDVAPWLFDFQGHRQGLAQQGLFHLVIDGFLTVIIEVETHLYRNRNWRRVDSE